MTWFGSAFLPRMDLSYICRTFVVHLQVFTLGQKATFEYLGTNYLFNVGALMVESQAEGEVVRDKWPLDSLTLFDVIP
jgi:hypothetical protein